MSKQPTKFEQLGFGISRYGFGCVEIIDKNGNSIAEVYEDQEQKYVISWLQDTDLRVDEKKASEIIEKLVLPGKQDWTVPQKVDA